MTSVYDQYKNLTLQEQQYVRSHPHHALSIEKSRDIAFRETKKRFGHIGRNDKSDAFRHCFWSAVLVREIGYQNALQFTNAHESDPKNPPAEKAMDLRNNSIGLSIGRAGGNNTYLSGRCMATLLSSRLKVIKK
ncbi:MAG: hypothetical protein LGR52_10780 [Candidatus Thiosymbion ectosymbiont of Robbea hypermnestra]|nr:hypothetical protein [Candidatus Thiosymbion ectosymbiont of Robbea hypermnestra]